MMKHYRCRYCNKVIHWFCSVFPEEKGHGVRYVCQPCHDSCPSPKGSASPKVAKATPSEPGSVLQSVSDKQSQIAAESAKRRRITVTVPVLPSDKATSPHAQ
jgi:hypothetical protein